MNFNKKLAVAVSGAVLLMAGLMAGQVALADSATDIVDALVMKGVLTEEEGRLITKGHTSKTSVTPVVKEKDGAFTLESANGNNSISLTGRMHLDYRHNNMDLYTSDFNDRDTATGADNIELRRARLGVKGKFAKDFNYEIVGNLPGTATVDVAFVDYAKYSEVKLRLGRFKQPFNLEELTSSNNIDFMERSYVNQLAPAKKNGAMLFGEPKTGFTYALSAYSMNDTEQDSKNDKMNFAGRSTLNFGELFGNKTMVAHIGLSGFNAEYNVTPTTSSGSAGTTTNASILAFRTPGRGLSNIFAAQIGGSAASSGQSFNSNSTAQVKSSAVGLEGAFAVNNIKVQGEYARAGVKGSSGGTGTTGLTGDTLDLDANVYYGEVMYLATGETYAGAYKGGAFGSIKPTNNFDLDKNQWGAWEFGLRAEKYTVDEIQHTPGTGGATEGVGSTRIRGATSCESGAGSTTSTALMNGCKASSTTYTAGIKWILNPNAMVKLNYSRTNFGYEWEHFDLDDKQRLNKEDILMMRTQFAF
ncbi:OprP Phosphate-selective porin [Candidatus Methylopumilus universalis]|uniref:OprO/OprP family phosphate-selective porin n=1 Tax=Candidatus Methylopumilus universalis TaxID=2588536 RepID=UPI003BEEFEBE